MSESMDKFITGVKVYRQAIVNNENNREMLTVPLHGVPMSEFAQVYFSHIYPQKIVGWYRNHRGCKDWITCIAGRITLGMFDARLDSITYGKIIKLELADQGEHFRLVEIPTGVWYAYRSKNEVQPATVAIFSTELFAYKRYDHSPRDPTLLPFDWGKS